LGFDSGYKYARRAAAIQSKNALIINGQRIFNPSVIFTNFHQALLVTKKSATPTTGMTL
jgi:hypothetical protein